MRLFLRPQRLKNFLHQHSSSMKQRPYIAVISGASRGLGQSLASLLSQNGYIVIRAQRTLPDCSPPSAPSLCVKDEYLDLANDASIDAFALGCFQLPWIDLLINNAAVCPPYPKSSSQQHDHWRDVMQINFRAHLRLTQRLLPLLHRSQRHARVVNVSSGDGELLYFSDETRMLLQRIVLTTDICQLETDVQTIMSHVLKQMSSDTDVIFGGQPAYKFSKAALNVFTRVAARCICHENKLSFISVCPGDVDTDMADADAELISAKESARRMWPCLDISQPCKNGSFLRHAVEIPW